MQNPAAKVLIDISPSFREGGHERIFYGLSKGCCVSTNRSDCLDQDRAEHSFLQFHADDLSDIADVCMRLRDEIAPDAYERERMLAHYTATHTWRHRLEPVFDRLSRSGQASGVDDNKSG